MVATIDKDISNGLSPIVLLFFSLFFIIFYWEYFIRIFEKINIEKEFELISEYIPLYRFYY
jgi:hypothetical protein